MNALKKIVTSLEMSKDIQRAEIYLGETALVWVLSGHPQSEEASWKLKTVRQLKISNQYAFVHKIIPAPTEGDMWRILPEETELVKDKGYYADSGLGKTEDAIKYHSESPVKALAELAIWCKKEGYL